MLNLKILPHLVSPPKLGSMSRPSLWQPSKQKLPCGQANVTVSQVTNLSWMSPFQTYSPNLGSGKVSNLLLSLTNTQYTAHISIMKCNFPNGWFLNSPQFSSIQQYIPSTMEQYTICLVIKERFLLSPAKPQRPINIVLYIQYYTPRNIHKRTQILKRLHLLHQLTMDVQWTQVCLLKINISFVLTINHTHS